MRIINSIILKLMMLMVLKQMYTLMTKTKCMVTKMMVISKIKTTNFQMSTTILKLVIGKYQIGRDSLSARSLHRSFKIKMQ
jgi:hypothetical protein